MSVLLPFGLGLRYSEHEGSRIRHNTGSVGSCLWWWFGYRRTNLNCRCDYDHNNDYDYNNDYDFAAHDDGGKRIADAERRDRWDGRPQVGNCSTQGQSESIRLAWR